MPTMPRCRTSHGDGCPLHSFVSCYSALIVYYMRFASFLFLKGRVKFFNQSGKFVPSDWPRIDSSSSSSSIVRVQIFFGDCSLPCVKTTTRDKNR